MKIGIGWSNEGNSRRAGEIVGEKALRDGKITSPDFCIAFGSCYEESLLLIETIKARKIDVASIHYIESTRFQRKLIENIDIVRFAVCNAYKARNRASQVHKSMQFYCCFAFAKLCPWK